MARERVSTAPESNGGELYTTPAMALRMGILGLCAQVLSHGNPFHEVPDLKKSHCANVASRSSLQLGNECCTRGQAIFTCYVLQHSAVPFCELVGPTIFWLSRCCS